MGHAGGAGVGVGYVRRKVEQCVEAEVIFHHGNRKCGVVFVSSVSVCTVYINKHLLGKIELNLYCLSCSSLSVFGKRWINI